MSQHSLQNKINMKFYTIFFYQRLKFARLNQLWLKIFLLLIAIILLLIFKYHTICNWCGNAPPVDLEQKRGTKRDQYNLFIYYNTYFLMCISRILFTKIWKNSFGLHKENIKQRKEGIVSINLFVCNF